MQKNQLLPTLQPNGKYGLTQQQHQTLLEIFATVKGANGEVLREGSNGWVCVAFNPMPAGGFNTPHDANPACGDAASLAWVDAIYE